MADTIANALMQAALKSPGVGGSRTAQPFPTTPGGFTGPIPPATSDRQNVNGPILPGDPVPSPGHYEGIDWDRHWVPDDPNAQPKYTTSPQLPGGPGGTTGGPGPAPTPSTGTGPPPGWDSRQHTFEALPNNPLAGKSFIRDPTSSTGWRTGNGFEADPNGVYRQTSDPTKPGYDPGAAGPLPHGGLTPQPGAPTPPATILPSPAPWTPPANYQRVQPPMPTAPPGMAIPQVMPQPYYVDPATGKQYDVYGHPKADFSKLYTGGVTPTPMPPAPGYGGNITRGGLTGGNRSIISANIAQFKRLGLNEQQATALALRRARSGG